MRNERSKIIIIVVSIILVVSLLIGTLIFVFLKTDVFKNDQELFLKYLGQELNSVEQIADVSLEKEIIKKQKQENYESTTKISTDIKQDKKNLDFLKDITILTDSKKSNNEKVSKIELNYKNDSIFKTEYITNDNMISVRINDIKQYISVKNENIKQLLQNFGISNEYLSEIPDTIDFENYKNSMTEEELNQKIKKYTEIITNQIKKGKYSKQKNGMATVNEKTIKVNQYILIMSKEQVKETYLKILNELKEEDFIKDNTLKKNYVSQIDGLISSADQIEFQDIKVTLYENNKAVVRTMIEVGTQKYIIEILNQGKDLSASIQKVALNETEVQINANIKRSNTDNGTTLQIELTATQNNEEQKAVFRQEITKNNDNIQRNITIGANALEEIIEIKLEENILFNNDIKTDTELTESNNIVLNSLDSERLKVLIQILQKNITETFSKKMQEIQVQSGNTILNNVVKQDNGKTAVEINKFNSKFEFYSGDEVSTENVRLLLENLADNLESVEYVDGNTIKFKVKEGNSNKELINQVNQRIADNIKYKVELSYDTNNLIEYITITNNSIKNN